MGAGNYIRSLISRFSIDSSGVKTGADEIKARLTELNNAFLNNKAQIKTLNQEYAKYEEELKKLKKSMSDGGTEAQKAQLAALSAKMSDNRLKAAQLTTAQQDLRNQINATNKELKTYNSSFSETATAADTAKTSIFNMTNAIKGVVMGYTGKKLVEWLFGSTAELETYEKSFEVFLGSAEKAKALMSDMVNLGESIPTIGADAYAAQAKTLMSYGVGLEDITKTLTQLSDLAGGDASKLERIVLAYGQMVAKTKVQGEELRQMTEAGVPLVTTLAEVMGVSVTEFNKMMKNAEVGVDVLYKAVDKLTTGTGQFAGAAAAQAETMAGKIATFQKQWEQFGRDVGAEAFDSIKQTLDGVMETLEEARANGTIEEIADGLGSLINFIVTTGIGAIKVTLQFKEAIIGVAAAYATWKALDKGAEFIKALADGVKLARTAFVTLTSATKAQTTAQAANNAVASANPYIALAAAIMGVVAVFTAFAVQAGTANGELEKLREEMEHLNSEYTDNTAKNEAEIAILQSQASRYDELRQKTSLTAKEKAELDGIASQLKKTLGGEVEIVDSQTGSYKDLNEQIQNFIANSRNRIEMQFLEDAALKSRETLEKLKEDYSDAVQLKADWDLREQQFLQSPLAWFADGERLKELSVEGFTNAIKHNYGMMGDAVSKAGDKIDEEQETYNKLIERLNELSSEADNAGDKIDDTNDDLKDLADTAQTTAETLQELQAAVSLVSSAMSEQGKNGQISLSTYIKLKEAGYEAALSTNNLTGAFLLNIDTLKDLTKKTYEAKIAEDELALSQMRRIMISPPESAVKEMEDEIALYKALLKQLNEGTGEFSSSGSGSGGSSGTGKTAFELALADLKYNLDMEYITQKQYYDRLEALNEQHNKNNLDLYRQYEVEVKKGRDKLLDETVSANEKQLDSMLKSYNSYLDGLKQARKNAQEDEDLQSQINAVDTRLEYEQMDDFSRYELEKKRKELVKQQEDVAFDRMIEAKKTEAETLVTDLKGRIDLTSQQTTAALASVNAMLENMARYSQNITNNTSKTINNYSNSFALTNPYYSLEQIANYVIKKIGG